MSEINASSSKEEKDPIIDYSAQKCIFFHRAIFHFDKLTISFLSLFLGYLLHLLLNANNFQTLMKVNVIQETKDSSTVVFGSTCLMEAEE